MARSGERFPEAIICDHDAEDRATLTAKLRVPTIAAQKSVSLGIQAVKQRLLASSRAAAAVVFLAEAGIARDEKLVEAKQPTATEEEVELYVWRDGIKDSEPVKANDHGLDATRYLVSYLDGGKRPWTIAEIEAWGRDDLEELKRLERLGGTEPSEPSATPAREQDEDWQAQWLHDVKEQEAKRIRRLIQRGW